MHPKTFGPNLRKTIIEKLNQDVEGTCSGQYGFIIFVTAVQDIGAGVIQEGTGMVDFQVTYKAIVFRPFRNEVVDAVVTQVNKVWSTTHSQEGTKRTDISPLVSSLLSLLNFLSLTLLFFHNPFCLLNSKMGFFAEVGPLQVFVSKHLIPQDMEFDPQSVPPCYVSQGGEVIERIQKDTEVRLKIIGTRVDATEIVCTPSLLTQIQTVLHPNSLSPLPLPLFLCLFCSFLSEPSEKTFWDPSKTNIQTKQKIGKWKYFLLCRLWSSISLFTLLFWTISCKTNKKLCHRGISSFLLPLEKGLFTLSIEVVFVAER
jgi:DNA-directed RNA polymerase II subunit RPB7